MSLQPYARKLALHSKNARNFAASAAPKLKEDAVPFAPREQLKTSKVNNATIATVETNQPTSRLAVFFRAGSRFETDKTQGTAHMLRICAGLGTNGASQFGLTRSIEFNGGNLTCTVGREFVGYTIEAARDKISSVDRYLQDAVVNQTFKAWEVKDNVSRARLERSVRPPEIRVLELIHKAAFRKGLGYSVYSPKWMLGNHSSEILSNFVKENFSEAGVAAVGMPHEQAVDFVSRLNLKGGGGKTSAPSKFHAGADLRKETGDRLAYVALAVQGAGLGDPKKAAAAALVHRALGSAPRICGGLSPNAKLRAALGDNDVKATCVGFSASYTDSGLVGAYIAATPKSVGEITRKAADILRSAKFSTEDANRAKGILKGDLALVDEDATSLIEYLGTQSLLTGKPLTLSEQMSLVDSVSAEDMNAVLSGGKLSMAVFGNVASVPYLDELK